MVLVLWKRLRTSQMSLKIREGKIRQSLRILVIYLAVHPDLKGFLLFLGGCSWGCARSSSCGVCSLLMLPPWLIQLHVFSSRRDRVWDHTALQPFHEAGC